MKKLLALCGLAAVASAWNAPAYGGFNTVWQSTFQGNGGSSPDQGQWNILNAHLNVNAELETYTSSTKNVQLSGGQTLQIVPWRDGSVQGGWSSGRLESKYTFTPAAGRVTMAEAQIRFGGNAIGNKKGIWPAFWLLGDNIRHGTGWPACGEIDILETINGQLTGYGTMHCDVYPGGICNEPSGIAGTIGIPDQGWHTWRAVWDLTNGDWRAQTITWFRDGQQFNQISGARINNLNVWQSVTARPLFFILNVAVGGGWPGNPDGNTQDGFGSMMEVAYVAQYQN
jgi:beta-glucanase (GH16 family)